MKVIFEASDIKEVEVTVKGNATDVQVQNLLQYLGGLGTSSSKIILYKEEEQFIVNSKDIVYVEACNNKVVATTVTGTYTVKMKLYEVKERLSSQGFAQINKSILVNVDFVKSVQAEFSGNYTAKLKNSKETLTISRKYFKEFKSKI